MTAQRVVIVGAGITGLATAHTLLAKAPDTDVTLLETAGRAGGNISTERTDGFILDGGPDSWVSAKPHATDLAREIGLEPELVGTVEANRRVYVASKEGLHSLPEGFVLGVPTQLWPIVKTPLFSLGAKVRMGLEPFVPRRAANGEDESIASFVSRRLGHEVAERLVAPLLGGIYGGDASALSIRATTPAVRRGGGEARLLVMAMRAARRGGYERQDFQRFRDPPRRHPGGLIRIASRRRSGTEATDRGPGDVRYRDSKRGTVGDASRSTSSEGLRSSPTRWSSPCPPAPLHCSWRRSSRARPELLGAVPHASTAVVFLALRRQDVHRPLDATGYIVPRNLGSPVMAATWVSSKWDGRAPGGSCSFASFSAAPRMTSSSHAMIRRCSRWRRRRSPRG